MAVTSHLMQPTRTAWARKAPAATCAASAQPLFGLAPGGVYPATCVTASAVRSYRTVSPLPRRQACKAVYFLWHFPSDRSGRTLSATVFRGARTFLQTLLFSDHPAIWQGEGYTSYTITPALNRVVPEAAARTPYPIYRLYRMDGNGAGTRWRF